MKVSRTILLGMPLILALFVGHLVCLNCVTDDAYISFRYARNLATEGVLTWNPGQPPVEGYTNFLWVLIHAGVYKLGWSLPFFSQLLGAAAGVITLLLVFRLGRAGLRLTPLQALFPCLLLAVSGPLPKWSGGGLETSLFAMLIVAGCERYVAWWRGGRTINLALSSFLLFLSTLTRPEGLFIFGLLAALAVPFALAKPRRHALPWIAGVLVYAIPFTAYFIWRYRYFGYLLPNTFYAKTGGTVYQWLRGLEYTGWFAACFLLPMLVPVLAAAGAILERMRALPGALRRRGLLPWVRRRIGLLICLAVSVLYTLYIIYVGGDYMGMFRFYAPVMPFLALVAGAAVATAWRRGLTPGRRLAWAGLILIAAAGCALQSTPLEKKIFPMPARHHGTYRGLLSERWNMRRLTLLARFFDTRQPGVAASISTDAIGAIGYYSKLKVYDNQGLTDPYIAHLQVKDMGKGFASHEKSDYAYVLSKKPTYYMHDRYLHPAPPPEPQFPPDVDAILKRDYRYTSVWLEDPANHEAGYYVFFELKKSGS